MWRRWRSWIIAAVVVVLVVGTALVWPKSTAPSAPTEDVTITAAGGPGEDPTITLDATVYRPATVPAPAVILAHGLGGTKDSVVADAQDLAAAGYLVLAYTARGFGASDGHVHLDSLDYEIPDGRAVVDYLATRSDVVQDAAGDPRVGVMGGSYGGGLSLMLAGTDPRVDTAVPLITWNSLPDALFPNFSDDSTGPQDGVFKRYWASILMTSITLGGRGNGGADASALSGVLAGANGVTDSSATTPAPTSDGSATADGTITGGGATTDGGGTADGNGGADGNGAGGSPLAGALCGRLATDLCQAYLQAAETGVMSPELEALLDNSSPALVARNIAAPTLLIQGERDTLFGLDQSDANARAIAANGTPVSVLWFAGGHDGGGIDDQTRAAIHSWLDHYLAKTGPDPQLGFRYSIDGSVSDTGSVRSRMLQADGYPGIGGFEASTVTLGLDGRQQPVVNPPGGTPAAISSLPGVSGLASAALANLGLDVPGQSATFSTPAVDQQVLLTGAAQFTLTVTAGPPISQNPDADTGSATFFVKLYKESASGVRTLAGGAASPIRVDGLVPGQPVQVPVSLTPVALQVDPGSILQVVVSTTDQAFQVPTTASVHLIGVGGDGTISLPVTGGSNITTSDLPIGLLIALIALAVVAVVLLVLAGRVRKERSAADPALADVPLRITGLRKVYPGGVVAVKEVSFDVLAGQVVGLLGPNGAGKTTTLRMVMGLIFPTQGEIRVFGHRITAGSAVLSRIGSFVEGSGFLPHLSGRDNLTLYWAATGRAAAAAYLDQAMEIAGLGTAIDRKVRTYSQGMRQRLAIAQAMLGLPDLLLLDEPTNGLDPPQIHAMREVLRRYSSTGRTVLVSSHQLSEVEQTCTHAVVVNKGEVIASGTVADLIASSGEMSFTVDDPERAAAVLRELPGVLDVELVGNAVVHADLAGHSPSAAVASLVEAGIAVTSAAPRNRLEDVFLDLVGATGTSGLSGS